MPYEYLMVYLPGLSRSSFLLYTYNSDGAGTFRDYSGGRERRLATYFSPTEVMARTSHQRTRFPSQPHRTDDAGHWGQITRELNRTLATPQAPASTRNRAQRGSRRQLQDYVNQQPELLNRAILDALPPRLRELGANIRWASPLASENYEEYRDRDFLKAIALEEEASRLAGFWPAMGPCWDALGVISDPFGRVKPGAILVEAKSHIPEMYGSGCQAAGDSRSRIERALAETKVWLGVETSADWLGSLYQYANRLAHLHFLLNQVGTRAWLVNLYFLNDPIGPAGEAEWREAIAAAKRTLGLETPVRNVLEVFLPAIHVEDTDQRDEPSVEPETQVSEPAASPIRRETRPSFRAWSEAWMHLAAYTGAALADPEARIERLLDLWQEPIPGSWQRTGADIPQRLLAGRRYTRGDEASPRSGEHRIEHEILGDGFGQIECPDGLTLVDGVNAFPLVRDSGGGRTGNVEADLLLLARGPHGCSVLVGEVKDSANNAWYAAVENLRQLKLLLAGGGAGSVFRLRNPGLNLPEDLPVAGMVIAPREFYSSPGQKQLACAPARALVRAIHAHIGIEIRLAIWERSQSRLTRYQ